MACAEVEPNVLFVAAIDFGTTFSGYAFATLSDYKTNPLSVSSFTWATGSQTGISLKTPTCILFEPNGDFHSFGVEAEDKYTELAQEDKHKQWRYFRRFKMTLYDNKDMPRNLRIKDDQGREMEAMTVISESIRFLKNHMMGILAQRNLNETLKENEMLWVLTVPAIWSDAAKQFTREAAVKAGIKNRQLMLALEPEAASVYCKHIPNELNIKGGEATLDALSPGTKYLILDAGGGTIDITVQEVQSDESIKQLYMANGGHWGGTKVDEAFENFLQDFTNKAAIDQFKVDDKGAHLDLQREFEIKKRNIEPTKGKITIRFPVALKDAYKDVTGKELARTNSAKLERDKLRIENSAAQQLFAPTCTHIISHLQKIFADPKVEDTDTILMVGGFSESPVLQDAVSKAFPQKTIIIPPEAGLAVLKGAVQFGFEPRVISTRVCKETYGIASSMKFEDNIDPEDKKVESEGTMYCNNRFSKHVEIGQGVGIDEEFGEQVYFPFNADDKTMSILIYTSIKKSPRYIDENGCRKQGEITVHLPDPKLGKSSRGVGVKMIFGKTELEVHATVKHNGENTKAVLNFLR